MPYETVGQDTKSHEAWDMSDVTELKNEFTDNDVELSIENSAEKKAEEIAEKRQEILDTFHRDDGDEKNIVQETPEIDSPDVSMVRKEDNRQHPIIQGVKKIASTTGRGVLMSGACIGTVLAPYLAPILLPVAFLEAGSIRHTWNGINGSMFEVDGHNKITQTTNPIPFLRKYRGKESSEIFMAEAEKLFDGLEPGETYSTRSHAMTYQLLRRMEKAGKIQNLQKEEAGKSRLILESLATGNFKAIFRNKKQKMYNISFNVAKS